jgi:hypothetical protein
MQMNAPLPVEPFREAAGATEECQKSISDRRIKRRQHRVAICYRLLDVEIMPINTRVLAMISWCVISRIANKTRFRSL